MFDLFGRAKKKRKRVEKYKGEYRGMSIEGQELHRKVLVQCVIHGTFYNRAVDEMMQAAVEVHTEQGNAAGAERELRALLELKVGVDAALH